MKVLLVDDHALFREGLVHTLRGLEARVEVLEAGDAPQAKAMLAAHDDLDLLLLDLALPDVEPFELLELARKLRPTTPVVVLSANQSRFAVEHALSLGAQGYVFKSSPGQALLAALRRVMAGEVVAPSSAELGSDVGLTERQREVLKLLAHGMTNRELAEHLSVAENTVKVHLANIYRSLGASSRTHALARARMLGLIDHG
jgi:DNA-binding NarL/FixJ family response regulator